MQNLLLIGVLVVAQVVSAQNCLLPPRCAQSWKQSWDISGCAHFMNWGYEMEWWGKDAEHAAMQLQDRLSSIRGQDHAIPQIMNAVLGKLHEPNVPLVLQFSGDNGVGKTYTAEQISLALSLRCGSTCSKGDNMLVIGGTAYKGFALDEARKVMFGKIQEHARRYPHGIILINDIQSMDPDLVIALAPLFGREETFPEISDVALNKLIVLITNDFGKAGKTRGLGARQIGQLARKEFTDLYSVLTASSVRSYYFISVNDAVARDITALELNTMPCRGYPSIKRVHYDDSVLSFVVQHLSNNYDLSVENGRAIHRSVQDTIDLSTVQLMPKKMPLTVTLSVSRDGSKIVTTIAPSHNDEL